MPQTIERAMRQAVGKSRSPAKTRDRPSKRQRAGDHTTESAVSAEERYRMIATAAYYRAERRGFAPGGELEDWYAAEVEIDRRL